MITTNARFGAVCIYIASPITLREADEFARLVRSGAARVTGDLVFANVARARVYSPEVMAIMVDALSLLVEHAIQNGARIAIVVNPRSAVAGQLLSLHGKDQINPTQSGRFTVAFASPEKMPEFDVVLPAGETQHPGRDWLCACYAKQIAMPGI